MINSFRHWIIAAVMAIIAALPLHSQTPPTPAAPELTTQDATKKGLLLSFISYNSMESKIMNDQLAGDASVKALIEKHFDLVTYAEGRDSAQILRYQVKNFPTTIVAHADGTEIDRIVGFVRPQETTALLEAAAKGESTLTSLATKAAAAEAKIDDRLKYADAATKRGKYAEALRELTVCLDRSSAPMAKAERRYLKPVLARLMALSGAEPSARELVISRRDVMERTLSPHFPEPIMIVFAYNEALKQPERNVDVYLRIPAESPLRDRLYTSVWRQLVAQRRYQEAVEGADLESLVNSAYPKKQPKQIASVVSADGRSTSAPQINHAQRHIVELTGSALEALLGVGQLETAKRLAGRALDTVDSKEVKKRFEEAAQRAGNSVSTDFTTWLAGR